MPKGNYTKKTCPHCHEKIGLNAYAKHEELCKDSTPEERKLRNRYRLANAKYKGDRHRIIVSTTPKAKPAVAQPSANGQHLALTVSGNWDALGKWLSQTGEVTIDNLRVL